MGQLEKKGWEIIRSNNVDQLKSLRENIYVIVKKHFDLKENDSEIGMNLFHNHCQNLTDGDLNSKKISVISEISNNKPLVDMIFKSFDKKIVELVGKDILVQKTINVVIQKPFDKNPTIPHRDAPPNSFFELVIWIPLVDCQKSKSMYVLDIENTDNILKQSEKDPNEWEKFIHNFHEKKIYPTVNFGESLFFLPCIYHGSDINKTKETRFSLNIRFKNLFSPSGKKFPLHFFRPYKISEFTKVALEKTKKEFLK